MLKVNQVTYEIWDAESYEVLVDGLCFEDAAEQCKIYEDFFGSQVMVVAIDNVKIIDITPMAKQYKFAFMDYIETLLDNL